MGILNEEEIKLCVYLLSKESKILTVSRNVVRNQNNIGKALSINKLLDILASAAFKLTNELKDMEAKGETKKIITDIRS